MAGLIRYNQRNGDLYAPGTGSWQSVMDNFFGDRWLTGNNLSGMFRVDVREENTAYIVEADLPGVNKEDISLDANGPVLTINVAHEENKDEEDKNYIHRERYFASAQRRVRLRGADLDAASAKMENGVLRITVPKKDPQENANKIAIE